MAKTKNIEAEATALLRQHAEQEFAAELDALKKQDDRQKPRNWQLSPWAVKMYLLGGTLPDGTEISPKYIGNERLIEIAVATLATDRALLLYGLPGTAKSWVSEHLAAAISGDSTLLIQGTAGTDESALRYSWNYAQLLAAGPSPEALVSSPMMRAMSQGKLARVEELTRIGILLVEGPPESEEVLKLAADAEMKPPVALLVYPPEKPDSAVFYPFASFSPEWIAVQYSLKSDVPLRFMDLPWKHRFALDEQEAAQQADTKTTDENDEIDAMETVVEKSLEQEIVDDPLAVLSRAAGFDDSETWWEQVVEQSRGESLDIFTGILEAMTALRQRIAESSAVETTDESIPVFSPRRHEALREASMRQIVRQAIKDGFQKIAVVCGAWHAPVLNVMSEDQTVCTLIPPQKDDEKLLKGLPKAKVATTWTPWTFSRLAYQSGYGAGVSVPGWYEHLWTVPDRAVIRWISRAARLLREESLDASSANVIEAVRLAEALASMRDRPMPGIAEVNEAMLTVLCHGESSPLRLIRNRLETGYRIGSVPASAPAVPLLRDIESEQKRLRMKVSEEIVTLDLDLRKDTDRAKSRLLHRLNLLGVPWGALQRNMVRSTGTFHEFWQIQWQVEFVVRIIESNTLGNTLETAVSGAVRKRADEATSLPELTALIDAALPAEISTAALDDLLDRLKNEAAVSSDLSGMMLTLPPLVNILRYGNVRGTKTEHVEPVFNALFERVLIGLGPACGALDDDAAERRIHDINAVQSALQLRGNPGQTSDWLAVLAALARNNAVHGLVRGRCSRILYEQGTVSEEELAKTMSLALSPVLESIKVAQWIQGFLHGSGQMLLQFDPLWTILNAWLCTLGEDVFTELLPLLRRGFSEFSGPELRMMGAKVKPFGVPKDGEAIVTSAKPDVSNATEARLDMNRVELVLPVLRKILS